MWEEGGSGNHGGMRPGREVAWEQLGTGRVNCRVGARTWRGERCFQEITL